MHRANGYRLIVASLAVALTGCASSRMEGGWTRLVDGASGLDGFVRVGDANWSAGDGAIQATQGGKDPAYLVSRSAYKDFELRVEFWASDDANSGVFLRCQDAARITDENCYEVNIFDQRPDPAYGTGGIVKLAKAPDPMPKAGGKWNTYQITANGPRLVVVLNGTKTVDVEDSRLASGPLALQWGRGSVKFRKVEIRPL
jgi:Domain of Unknown Function (DUF1080)